VSTITEQQCKALAAEIKKATSAVLAKHGMEITKTSAQYGDSFKISISAVAVQTDKTTGVNMKSPEVSLYQKYGYTGYTSDFKELVLKAKIGTQFRHGNRTFVFAGVKGGRGRSQVTVLEKGTGVKYFFNDAIIPTLNAASKKK
jgi:hypothetical protein